MSEVVEIWFKIQKDQDGYPESEDWEQLHAWPVDQGFRLDNIPFFVKDIAVGDVISATLTHKGYYRFDHKISASGHSTFRIWLSAEVRPKGERLIEQIIELGGRAEITLERLIAIDAPPDHEPAIWAFLEAGRERAEWEIQVGYSPD